MREKADLKERLEELEHRCIQLSGETDTIGMFRQHKTQARARSVRYLGTSFWSWSLPDTKQFKSPAAA